MISPNLTKRLISYFAAQSQGKMNSLEFVAAYVHDGRLKINIHAIACHLHHFGLIKDIRLIYILGKRKCTPLCNMVEQNLCTYFRL